jgi:hypothetical protein
MGSFTRHEYLSLIQQLTEQQYGDSLDKYNVQDMEWMPAEPLVKPKPPPEKIIDLTGLLHDQIAAELDKSTKFTLDSFRIRIYKNSLGTYSISVHENRKRTPNGFPCDMDFSVNFNKDSRFKNREWTKQFSGNCACDLTADGIVEVLRWLKASKTMLAFM